MRAGAGGRITQRPKQIQDAESLAEGETEWKIYGEKLSSFE